MLDKALLVLFVAAAAWAFAGCGTAQYAVLTQHNDAMRTGVYASESRLTPRAVDPRTGSGMVLRYWRPVDAGITAQLLYAPRLNVAAGQRDVVFAFTSNNTVYAFDLNDEGASGTSEGLLWSRSLPWMPAPALPSALGILSTPVIELDRYTMYLVYGISNGLPPDHGVGDGSYEVEYHLAALDIRTGALLRDTAVGGSRPSAVAPGHVDFVARRQIQRGGLLLAPSPVDAHARTIYIPFASRWAEETHNWHGWVLGYDAETFSPRGVFCSTPDRRANSEGGGIWQGGGGLAADPEGNVYFNTGNGPGSGNDHGNSIVKLTPVRTPNGAYDFAVTAFSAAADDPAHAMEWANDDIDLAGGGVTVIPNSAELAGGGKTGVLYMMNRATMAKVQSFEAFTNTYNPALRYNDWMSGPHLHGAPTYWQLSANRGLLFDWSEKDHLKRFEHDRTTGLLNVATALVGDVVATPDLMPGGLISLSANGDRDGVLWITLPTEDGGATIYAYDAIALRRLWEAHVAFALSHNNPPTIAEGRVIVGAQNGSFLVYGLAGGRRFPLTPVFPPPPYIYFPPDPAPRVRRQMGDLPADRAAALVPRAGNRAAFLARGTGTLLYEAKAAAGGKVGWALVGATGTLTDESGVMSNMGRGGLGHTIATADKAMGLAAHDGGALALTLQAAVDAPKAGDAAWSLFSARPDGKGLLGAVTYVQRLGTKGGAPTQAAAPGARAEEKYEALYVFYVARGKPDEAAGKPASSGR